MLAATAEIYDWAITHSRTTMFADTEHWTTMFVSVLNAMESILHSSEKITSPCLLNIITFWCVFGLHNMHVCQLNKLASNNHWEPKCVPKSSLVLGNHMKSISIHKTKCLSVFAMKIRLIVKFQFFHQVYSSRIWSRLLQIKHWSKFCKMTQLWFQFPGFRLHRKEWS